MDWVSVRDKLPPEGKSVLVYTGFYMDIAYREDNQWYDLSAEEFHGITHWRNVPKDMKWTFIQDALPKAKKRVLVHTQYNGILVAYYQGYWSWWSSCGPVDDVTHWAELPKPPKEVK